MGSLGCNKPEEQAVHTHFLFVHLFPVLRQQLTVLTREACNYLGHAYSTVAAHFLVTVELLGAQFQLPSVYIDSELVPPTLLIHACVPPTLLIHYCVPPTLLIHYCVANGVCVL